MFEQIRPGVFVIRYDEAADLAPERQGPLIASVKAASQARPAALVFVVAPAVRSVDVAVPAFWLAATKDPAVRVSALAVASPNMAVRVATAGFGAASALRGSKLRAKAFAFEEDAIAWAAAELEAAKSPAAA